MCGQPCGLNSRLTEIATGGPELRRMREGGRIPIREKGKHAAPCRKGVEVFLFPSVGSFPFLLSREGLGWVLFLLSLFLLRYSRSEQLSEG